MLSKPDTDRLSLGVVRFTSWVLVIAGGVLGVMLAMSSTSVTRIGVNFAVSFVGAVVLLLVGAGRPALAAHLLVGGMWVLVTSISWLNGGLNAPNLMSYPVLLMVAGWLLGTRPTLWLWGITATTLGGFFYANLQGWSPALWKDGPPIYLAFLQFLMLATVGVTLLSRRNYHLQLDEVKRSSATLLERDRELQKISQVVEQSPDSIMITNMEPRIEYVNDAFVTHTGYSREEALGQNPNMLRSGNTPASVYADLWATLARGERWHGELLNRRKDGNDIIESAIIAPIRQEDGQITHYVSVEKDITDLKRAQSKIHRLANYDPLTGLPNRALLMDRLEQVLALSRRKPDLDVLILFNVDRFKNLNDARGQAVGDLFLVAMGRRIEGLLREGDTLARLAGDEFAILLQDMGANRDTASRRSLKVAKKIQESLRLPFSFGTGDEVTVTASLGVTVFPNDDSDSTQEILRRADTALHRAKEAGGSQVAFFDSAMGDAAEQRFRIERELRQAVSAGELRIFLQPQVDTDGHRVGAEVLVRWQHPTRGLIPPMVFIGIAEESDLIMDLGDWVMTQACRLIAAEEAAGIALNLSVNISPRHFRQQGFVAWIDQVLSATGANPARLTLEITEGLVIDNIDDVIAKMQELTARGIRFSIDDFGTGYSSLAYLKRLPIHELKIDKSFVQDAPTNADDAALVETILAVASLMHLQVVAEGVETEEQAAFLNARGKIIHQGYLFGRPQAAEVWLSQWRG